MKLRVISTRLALLGAAFALQGCIAAVGVANAQAEQERLAELSKWEANVQTQDCAGLDETYAKLAADKDGLVDFDQREDFMRDQYEQKSCPLPDGLA
ncbi:MAG: hypothetical protein AAF479_16455 [Pseudomonadota bacterium]